MSEIVILGIVIAILSVAVLVLGVTSVFMAVRIRRLHGEVSEQRDAADSARAEYKTAYVEQGSAMQALTREAVSAITTITHMMDSVIKGTESGTNSLSVDFNKLENRIESWMQTISQILSRMETRGNVGTVQVSTGQSGINQAGRNQSEQR